MPSSGLCAHLHIHTCILHTHMYHTHMYHTHMHTHKDANLNESTRTLLFKDRRDESRKPWILQLILKYDINICK